jgi:hypothetical protein
VGEMAEVTIIVRGELDLEARAEVVNVAWAVLSRLEGVSGLAVEGSDAADTAALLAAANEQAADMAALGWEPEPEPAVDKAVDNPVVTS